MPPHAHVISQDGGAKFQVGDDVALIANAGMKAKDVNLAESIIEDNKENITNAWTRIHGKENR